MARALDRFDVPSPSPGFLDRVARVPVAGPVAPATRARRLVDRGRRGAWARRTMIGVVALGLASATAAATGVFESIRVRLPAIATILAPSPPPPVAVAVHHPARKRPKPVAPPPAPPSPEAIDPEPSPIVAVDLRARWQALPAPVKAVLRERAMRQTVTRVQNRLADRGIDVPRPVIRAELERRQALRMADRREEQARREALGLPPPPPTPEQLARWARQRARAEAIVAEGRQLGLRVPPWLERFAAPPAIAVPGGDDSLAAREPAAANAADPASKSADPPQR
ncbi:MAG: hypothetical protein B7Y45_05365 [Sphingomonas sp. 28-66-16]|nr:MAG: hypothetical protein B7Y45_05365 [Sphingomonas sp. 28-66-16]